MFHNAVVEIGKTTSFGQELIEVGRKEGLEKGLEKGLTGLTVAIRAYLESAYPKLANDRSIDRIGSLEQASTVLKKLYRAKSEAEAKSILRGR